MARARNSAEPQPTQTQPLTKQQQQQQRQQQQQKHEDADIDAVVKQLDSFDPVPRSSSLKKRGGFHANGHGSTAAAASAATATPPPSSSSSSRAPSLLWSPNPERARGEQFFLAWALVWVPLMGYIVASRWFEDFTPNHYMALGILLLIGPIAIPLLFPAFFLSHRIHWTRRYTTKANVYIFILAWMANYFWTHYFYTVLHATYTLDVHRLNYVPLSFYFITHSYFHLYHVLASILMRLLYRCTGPRPSVVGYAGMTIALFAACWVVSFLEAFTMQNFPYYDIPDRPAMYIYGSMFYAMYFMCSFPLFFRLDETGNKFTLFQSFIEAMGCSMLITQVLDFWRITIGEVVHAPAKNAPAPCTVPFVF